MQVRQKFNIADLCKLKEKLLQINNLTVPSAPGPLATPAASNAAPTACSDASNAPARLKFSLKLSIQSKSMPCDLKFLKKMLLLFKSSQLLFGICCGWANSTSING